MSIVTPSYNQGQFIEETIRSVLLQGYPDLEYIIMDGGSTDSSVEIIRKYKPWLAYWVSEPDRGQSHAINKGWQKATGEIVAWLNSDDTYEPGAVARAVEAFRTNPEAVIVHGACAIVDAGGAELEVWPGHDCTLQGLLLQPSGILQPTAFVRRAALDAVGFLDESLHYVMDIDLWLRIRLHYRTLHLAGPPLARHRRHPSAKTVSLSPQWAAEMLKVVDRFCSAPDVPTELAPLCRRAHASAHFRLAAAAALAHQPAVALSGLWQAFRVWPPYLVAHWWTSLGILKNVAAAAIRTGRGPRASQ